MNNLVKALIATVALVSGAYLVADVSYTAGQESVLTVCRTTNVMQKDNKLYLCFALTDYNK